MHPLLDELNELQGRANALWQTEGAKRHGNEDEAKAEYKAIKGHVAERLKEFERREAQHVEPWISSTFSAALRNAHIAMRSPVNTSPRNSGWQSSVYDLCHELGYYSASLAKGLSEKSQGR